MEKVIACKNLEKGILESTAYRCLFEYIKKYGTELLYDLANDAYNLPNKKDLINQAFLCSSKENIFSLLEKKHKIVLKYLKRHKEEMQGIDFTDNFLRNLLFQILWEERHYQDFSTEISQKYLDNAILLENLKIQTINSLNKKDYGSLNDLKVEVSSGVPNTKIEFLPDKKYIYELCDFDTSTYRYSDKFYTDGVIKFLENDPKRKFCTRVLILRPSFILSAIKLEYKEVFPNLHYLEGRCGIRRVYMEEDSYNIFVQDFNFDRSLLPSLEELQSKEKPKMLNKILADEKIAK